MAKLRRPPPEATPRGASTDGRPRVRHDPRWILSPQAGRVAAHLYYCMVGEYPSVHLHGWVALLIGDHGDGPTAATVWTQHGEALIAEAEAAGFVPWMVTKKRPRGDAVRAWEQAFVEQHRY